MTAPRPLPTLLSQVLVAFTIEFDNESERQIREAGVRRFLVSLVMWSNYMRFVGPDGLAVHELQALAGDSVSAIHSRLGGLERWGYVTVEPAGAAGRSPARRDRMVRATSVGRRAQKVWRPLVRVIEERWRERFGEARVGALRGSLEPFVERFDPAPMPHYLPVVSYGMITPVPHVEGRARDNAAGLGLPALMSQVLLAFTIEFERESDLSLAISADVLRVLDEEGVRLRDLPRLSGVSKEAISASVGFLHRGGYAVVEADPTASRGKRVRLAPKGRAAREAYGRLLVEIEERWQERFGADELGRLRESLEWLLAQPEGEAPRLSQGLRPHPDGWRARNPYATQTAAVVRDPSAALPHHPMVLHRGGWPDGS